MKDIALPRSFFLSTRPHWGRQAGMPFIFPQIYLHLVWATFNRRPSLSPLVEPPVQALIAHRCRKLGVKPLAINGMSDHIHVLVEFPTTISVACLIGDIKGASAHVIQEMAPAQRFRWQRGYAVFPSAHPPSAGSRAISNKKQHYSNQGRCKMFYEIKSLHP